MCKVYQNIGANSLELVGSGRVVDGVLQFRCDGVDYLTTDYSEDDGVVVVGVVISLRMALQRGSCLSESCLSVRGVGVDGYLADLYNECKSLNDGYEIIERCVAAGDISDDLLWMISNETATVSEWDWVRAGVYCRPKTAKTY